MKRYVNLNKMLIPVFLLIFLSTGLPVLAIENTAEKAGQTNISPAEKKDQLVVYYFHGNMRCRTCKTIEALTKKAVAEGFSENLKNGSMALQVVNVDQSENSHFVSDYQLYTRSVVVSSRSGGEEKRWKRLDRIWDLVHDEDAFVAYIQSEISSAMKGDS